MNAAADLKTTPDTQEQGRTWFRRARANVAVHLLGLPFLVLAGVLIWPLIADLQQEAPLIPWLAGLYALAFLIADVLNVSTLLRLARRVETGQNLVQAKRGYWLFREKQFARMLTRPGQSLFTRLDMVIFTVLALLLGVGSAWLWTHRSTPPERQHRTALGHVNLLNYRGTVTRIQLSGHHGDEVSLIAPDQRSATQRITYGEDMVVNRRYRLISGPTSPQGHERTVIEEQETFSDGTMQTSHITFEGSCIVEIRREGRLFTRTCDALGRPLREQGAKYSATYRYMPFLPLVLTREQQSVQIYTTDPPTWEQQKWRDLLLLQPDGAAISQRMTGSKVTRKFDSHGNWTQWKHESIQITTGQPETNLTIRQITYR